MSVKFILEQKNFSPTYPNYKIYLCHAKQNIFYLGTYIRVMSWGNPGRPRLIYGYIILCMSRGMETVTMGEREGWVGWTDGSVDGWMDGWMDG